MKRLSDFSSVGKIKGDPERVIENIISPEHAGKNSLCVIWDKNFLENLDEEILIAAPEDFFSAKREGIICENPRASLPILLNILNDGDNKKLTGIHEKAFVHESANINSSAYVGACAYVGENCVVGAESVIEPGAVLLKNVKVGEKCLIHSGAVIGCDGFGFERSENGLIKIPQNGGVKIGDNVEIGACTTIDRGTLNDTEIKSGTKIDNHVQIGHNVVIGENCIICSMTGIAGSSIIEDNVTISVQAGITDHVKIGAGAIIAARTGVTNDIKSGAVVSGFPARPHNDNKRALILASRLPDLFRRLNSLEHDLNEIAKQ